MYALVHRRPFVMVRSEISTQSSEKKPRCLLHCSASNAASFAFEPAGMKSEKVASIEDNK